VSNREKGGNTKNSISQFAVFSPAAKLAAATLKTKN